MDRRHAVVVGGGIGGLSAAIGLRMIGWQVTVLERSAAFTEVGAGITLWPNALRGLHALGLADEVQAVSVPQRAGGLRNRGGHWLSRWDGTALERQFGSPMVAIHRAHLLRMLLAALPSEVTHTGHPVGGVREDGTVVGLDVESADLIVGADGIDSGIRRQLWPDHPGPVDSGYTAWRGICRPIGDIDIAVTWGRGTEFGVVPLTDGRVYWYASVRTAENIANEDEKAFLAGYFGSWHSPIPDLIDATPAEAVLRHDLRHLDKPLSSYVRGRVALLGDAAHAMTPHLGQGGCQAIEDAVVLASALGRFPEVAAALGHYDAHRRPRSQAIARSSRWIGRCTSGLTNPLATAIRDTATRLTPQRLSLRSMASVSDWSPPPIVRDEAAD